VHGQRRAAKGAKRGVDGPGAVPGGDGSVDRDPVVLWEVPVTIVLARGVGETSCRRSRPPARRSLAGWGGRSAYFAVHRFIGLPDPRAGHRLALVWRGLVALGADGSHPSSRGPSPRCRDRRGPPFALEFRLQDGPSSTSRTSIPAPIAVTLRVVGTADLVRRAARGRVVGARVRSPGRGAWPSRSPPCQRTARSSADLRAVERHIRERPRGAGRSRRGSVRIDMVQAPTSSGRTNFLAPPAVVRREFRFRVLPHPPLGRQAGLRAREPQHGPPPTESRDPTIRENPTVRALPAKAEVPGTDGSSRACSSDHEGVPSRSLRGVLSAPNGGQSRVAVRPPRDLHASTHVGGSAGVGRLLLSHSAQLGLQLLALHRGCVSDIPGARTSPRSWPARTGSRRVRPRCAARRWGGWAAQRGVGRAESISARSSEVR